VKKFWIITLLLSGVVGAFAQRGWEAGVGVGVAHYFGDLNTEFNLAEPGLSVSGIARYNFNHRLALKFAGSYGQVMADDADSRNIYEQARNLNFESDIWDAAVQFEFNFMHYEHGSKDAFFSPYLFGGFNVFYFNPTTMHEGDVVELQPLGTEGQFRGEEYSRADLGLVYGGGIKVSVDYRWSLNLEISARRLYTDYLDDVSTVYADPDVLEDFRGPLAAELADRSIAVPGVNPEDVGRPGRQRGNAKPTDSYVFTRVSVLYYFGDLRCPDVSRRN